MPSDSSPPKCCCFRIDEGAKILAKICIVLAVMTFGMQIYQRQRVNAIANDLKNIGFDEEQISSKEFDYFDEFTFWIYPFHIVIYALVLVGCYRRVAIYFLPFLIFMAFIMIFGILGLFLLAISSAVLPTRFKVTILLTYAINCWIYWVFYKAYKFIKEEQNSGGPNQLPIFYQQPAQNPGAEGSVMMQNDQQYYQVQQKSY